MTGTSTSGAEWRGGGETKALGRIFGAAAIEDDDEALESIQRVPAMAVHQASQDDIDLAMQLDIAAAAVKEAEGAELLRVRAGNALLKLQEIFCRVDRNRDAIIERMRDEGYSYRKIGAAIGRNECTIRSRYNAIKAKRPLSVSRDMRGRFLDWAATQLNRKRKTIEGYMRAAREPEQVTERFKASSSALNSAAKLGRAILAAQKRPGVPEPLRRTFQALPAPARERWLVWAASLLIGSDDPQTIAGWFATRFTAAGR